MRLAGLDIEHGHRSGANIGGIAARSVGRDGEHVRLLLAGRNGADDLQRLRIDQGDILIEFRGHVEQSIMLVIDHAMRAERRGRSRHGR